MNKAGPIIVIEDDEDDQEVFKKVLTELNNPNEIIFFSDGLSAYEYLSASNTKPFMIISDINLPKLDGFKLREMIQTNEQLRLKCTPYLFFTTAVDQKSVIDAYSQSVQGFFTKPGNYAEIARVIKNIIEYWKDCHSPNITE